MAGRQHPALRSSAPTGRVLRRLLSLSLLAILVPAAPAPAAENSAFREAANRAFHTLHRLDRRVFVDTTARTPDDGVIVLRWFIPSGSAGGRYLEGDARSFSWQPFAKSRAWLTWDVRNGAMSMVVARSCRSKYAPVNDRCEQALPLKRYEDFDQVWHKKDKKRYDNRFAVRSTGYGFDARVSLLNPYTNGQGVTAWSVDFDVKVRRAIDNRYRLQVLGNGYPAIEMYWYPREGVRRAVTQALRPVQDGMFSRARKLVDPGGGLGAFDRESWNLCRQPTAFSMSCHAYRAGGDWSHSWR